MFCFIRLGEDFVVNISHYTAFRFFLKDNVLCCYAHYPDGGYNTYEGSQAEVLRASLERLQLKEIPEDSSTEDTNDQI